MPLMVIEVAQKENQTGAAVESFRNEVIRTNNENQQLYLDSVEKRERGIIPATITPLNPVINLLTSDDTQGEVGEE
jgi:replication-associated recombination protein RarA